MHTTMAFSGIVNYMPHFKPWLIVPGSFHVVVVYGGNVCPSVRKDWSQTDRNWLNYKKVEPWKPSSWGREHLKFPLLWAHYGMVWEWRKSVVDLAMGLCMFAQLWKLANCVVHACCHSGFLPPWSLLFCFTGRLGILPPVLGFFLHISAGMQFQLENGSTLSTIITCPIHTKSPFSNEDLFGTLVSVCELCSQPVFFMVVAMYVKFPKLLACSQYCQWLYQHTSSSALHTPMLVHNKRSCLKRSVDDCSMSVCSWYFLPRSAQRWLLLRIAASTLPWATSILLLTPFQFWVKSYVTR